MKERRLVGIWLVAAYFFAKAAVVAFLAARAVYAPADALESLKMICEVLPAVGRINAGPDGSVVIAFMFAVFGLVVGICILARQKWAAAYIVFYHGFALIWFLIATFGLKMIGFNSSTDLLSSTHFKFEAAASLLMVAYLFQPRVLRSFGFS